MLRLQKVPAGRPEIGKVDSKFTFTDFISGLSSWWPTLSDPINICISEWFFNTATRLYGLDIFELLPFRLNHQRMHWFLSLCKNTTSNCQKKPECQHGKLRDIAATTEICWISMWSSSSSHGPFNLYLCYLTHTWPLGKPTTLWTTPTIFPMFGDKSQTSVARPWRSWWSLRRSSPKKIAPSSLGWNISTGSSDCGSGSRVIHRGG